MRRLKLAAVWLFAAACLALALRGVDGRAFLQGLAGIHWGWVAAGIAFDVLSYVSQGWRWRMLLEPGGRLSTLKATQAIYAGLFTNEVLPLRLGEVVRAYLASRWTGLGLSAIAPTLALERLMDGLWLVAGVAAATVFVPLPGYLQTGAWLLAAMLAAGVIALIVLLVRKPAHPPRTRLGMLLREMSGQVREASRTGALWRSAAASGMLLGGQILAFWCIQRACSLPPGLLVAAVVLLVVRLGTVIPNAPANVGSYQFFVVVGLSLFGVDRSAAAVFSVVVFVLLTVPLWALGFLAIRASGTTFAQLRRAAVGGDPQCEAVGTT